MSRGYPLLTAQTLALKGWVLERVREPGLAVDGGTVCFGFPCGADDPHEAASKLLQDHPLCLVLRLLGQLSLLRLFQQTLARCFSHLLRHERVGHSEIGQDMGITREILLFCGDKTYLQKVIHIQQQSCKMLPHLLCNRPGKV